MSTGETVLAMPRWMKGILYVGLPAIGLVVGYFIPRLADWASGLDWIPFQGPVELVAGFDGWWVALITTVIGLVGGLILAGMAMDESLEATVTDDEVRFKLNGKTRTFARPDVRGVFLDDKQLVLLGPATEELAREKHESTPAQIAAAFESHGYPWLPDGDPHAGDFRRWVEDTPDLPGAVNALLKARARALEKDEETDIAELRTEVMKLGYVIRDDDARQYWRPTRPTRPT